MVALAVICHNEVDLFEVDLFFEILHEVKAVRGPDGVDQRRFFFLDQIGVLAGPIHDRIIVAVEALQLPVDIADPAHVIFYVFSLKLKTFP